MKGQSEMIFKQLQRLENQILLQFTFNYQTRHLKNYLFTTTGVGNLGPHIGKLWGNALKINIIMISEFKNIGQWNRIKNRFNIMETINSFSEDMQSEVDFGVGEDDHKLLKFRQK